MMILIPGMNVVDENEVNEMSRVIRVIPCLDVKDGRVVKGVKFENLRDAGNPAELAHLYSTQGADEVAMLDLAASNEGRTTRLETVQGVADACRVPLTVGGGVGSVEDVRVLLERGVAKVSVSTAAFTRPELINEVTETFGKVLILSLDARRTGNVDTDGNPLFEVTTHGGTKGTGVDAIEWAREAAHRGVAEVLVNSIDQDGVRDGFDLDLVRAAHEALEVPTIASGGAGTVEHFVQAAQAGADSVLGASVFHFGTVAIKDVKAALVAAGFEVEHDND